LYVAVDYGYKGNGAVLAFEEDGILKNSPSSPSNTRKHTGCIES
jgi:hypothetical protein